MSSVERSSNFEDSVHQWLLYLNKLKETEFFSNTSIAPIKKIFSLMLADLVGNGSIAKKQFL
jgi:hypothetical protein